MEMKSYRTLQMKGFLLPLLILPLSAAGLCGLITLSEDTISVKEQMKKLFPAGSSVYAAETALINEGFTCSYMKNSDFIETDGRRDPVYHRNISFLYCSLERSRGILSFTGERWQSAIVHEGGRVKDIYISYGTTGL